MNSNQREVTKRATDSAGGEHWPTRWLAVPPEERRVLGEVRLLFQGLKRSKVSQVAAAARKWDLSIAFFIDTRLTYERPRRGARSAERGE